MVAAVVFQSTMNRSLLYDYGVALVWAAVWLTACTGGYEQRADGVVVRVDRLYGQAPGQLRIQVVSDKILRIRSLHGDSLVAGGRQTAGASAPLWRVEQKDGDVVIQTAVLQARVSTGTGHIVFADAQGRPVLAREDSTSRSSLGQVQSAIMPVQQAPYATGATPGFHQVRDKHAAAQLMMCGKNSGLLWNDAAARTDYYFIYGKDLDEVMAGYRTLTGKAPFLPAAAFGPQGEARPAVPGQPAAGQRGKPALRWQDLEEQIHTGLNLSLSGEAYWQADFSGFAEAAGNAEDVECATRALQFAAFCPLFKMQRAHPVAANVLQHYADLRYRFLPYLYALAARVHYSDYTLMRPLVMDFPNDQAVHNLRDEYMLGPGVLVAPVTEFMARNWKVYLPAGTGWYDFYTGKFYEGGQTVQAHAPLEHMPLFVRAGSIVPLAPLPRDADKTAGPVMLYVFTGANGAFDFYEAGAGAHEDATNRPAVISMYYDEATGTLTLAAGKSKAGDPAKQTFHIVWVESDRAEGIDKSTRPRQPVLYDGAAVIVKAPSTR